MSFIVNENEADLSQNPVTQKGMSDLGQISRLYNHFLQNVTRLVVENTLNSIC
jgi:hypothetical protein